MSEKYDEVIKKLSEVASQVFPSKEGKVFLYGSRARGEAHKDSDWDILVITQHEANSQDAYDKYVFPFAQIGWDLDEEIIPINYSEEEWAKRKNSLFYRNVMQDALQL